MKITVKRIICLFVALTSVVLFLISAEIINRDNRETFHKQQQDELKVI